MTLKATLEIYRNGEECIWSFQQCLLRNRYILDLVEKINISNNAANNLTKLRMMSFRMMYKIIIRTIQYQNAYWRVQIRNCREEMILPSNYEPITLKDQPSIFDWSCK